MDKDNMFTFSKVMTEHSNAATLWTLGATFRIIPRSIGFIMPTKYKETFYNVIL